MNPKRITHPRGFAIFFAIALLGLVSLAVMLQTKNVGYEVRRTRLAHEDAQLRQLLLAGAQSVRDKAATWADVPKPRSWTVELPTTLDQDNCSLSVECSIQNAGEMDAIVAAHLGDREAVQTLHLNRAMQSWHATSAGLGVTSGAR